MKPPAEESSRSQDSADLAEKTLGAKGLQLHLGSGPYSKPGWISVDKSRVAQVSRSTALVRILASAGFLSEQQRRTRWPDDVVRMDVTKRFVWEDNSVRAIYTSHMLEHLSRGEARHVLGQCRRVLAPGGVLRLVLPNLEAAVRRYLGAKQAGDRGAADALIEFLYLVPEQRDARWPQRVGMRLFHRPHLWMYDAASLLKVLSEVGFPSITRCSFRQGVCPDLDSLETRRDDLFPDDSFYVEAFKS